MQLGGVLPLVVVGLALAGDLVAFVGVGGISLRLSFFAGDSTVLGGSFSLLAVSIPKLRGAWAELCCPLPRCSSFSSHPGRVLSHLGRGLSHLGRGFPHSSREFGPLLGGLPREGDHLQVPAQSRQRL